MLDPSSMARWLLILFGILIGIGVVVLIALTARKPARRTERVVREEPPWHPTDVEYTEEEIARHRREAAARGIDLTDYTVAEPVRPPQQARPLGDMDDQVIIEGEVIQPQRREVTPVIDQEALREGHRRLDEQQGRQ